MGSLAPACCIARRCRVARPLRGGVRGRSSRGGASGALLETRVAIPLELAIPHRVRKSCELGKIIVTWPRVLARSRINWRSNAAAPAQAATVPLCQLAQALASDNSPVPVAADDDLAIEQVQQEVADRRDNPPFISCALDASQTRALAWQASSTLLTLGGGHNLRHLATPPRAAGDPARSGCALDATGVVQLAFQNLALWLTFRLLAMRRRERGSAPALARDEHPGAGRGQVPAFPGWRLKG